ncbi:MAG: hypothetical protein ACRC1K_22485 [Planctomycetia bacterium]
MRRGDDRTDGGRPGRRPLDQRRRDLDGLPLDRLDPFPPPAVELVDPGPGLWAALADAAGCAADERARYSLDCVQLAGAAGWVVGTDGRQVYWRSGFRLPWPDDLLVPASPLLGRKEIASDDVLVGRSAPADGQPWVWFAAGPWRVGFKTDVGRFPDVTAVVPHPLAATAVLHVDERDAAFLRATLPKLPGRDDADAPATLDLGGDGGEVLVRAPAAADGPATDLVLSYSRSTGGPLAVRTNRDYLARALRLGFREFRFAGSRPAACGDPDRTYAWALLDGRPPTVRENPDAVRLHSAASAAPPKSTRGGRRLAPSATREAATPPAPAETAAVDPLEAAKRLRDALVAAAADADRLAKTLEADRARSTDRSTPPALEPLKEAA